VVGIARENHPQFIVAAELDEHVLQLHVVQGLVTVVVDLIEHNHGPCQLRRVGVVMGREQAQLHGCLHKFQLSNDPVAIL